MRLQLILLAALQFSDSKYMLTFISRSWEGVEKIGRTSSLYRANKLFVPSEQTVCSHMLIEALEIFLCTLISLFLIQLRPNNFFDTPVAQGVHACVQI